MSSAPAGIRELAATETEPTPDVSPDPPFTAVESGRTLSSARAADAIPAASPRGSEPMDVWTTCPTMVPRQGRQYSHT